MNLRKRMQEPNVLLRLGLMFLIVAAVCNRFLHPTLQLSEPAADALMGLLYGLAIGFMLLSVRRRRRGCSKHA